MIKQLFRIISLGMLLFACTDKMDITEGGNPCDEIVSSLYQEKDGLLVIELENGDLPDGWEIRTTLSNFLGASYIQWEGNDNMGKPGPGIIQYKIKIDNPGTYRVQIRNYIAEGTSSTEHNDVWLRLADADDYYGDKKGHLVYPKGTGR